MGNGGNSKLKPIYVLRFLMAKTDEDHPATVQEIIDELKSLGLSSERKSIYEYVELLQEYGVDIICHREKRNRYFIGERDFQLAELKLLVDAVQYSKFITQKKSESLVNKIKALASENQAKQLDRLVYVNNRLKGVNESIYFNVDIIHTAIAGKLKIAFKYFDYDLTKQRKYRRNGAHRTVAPCDLIWDDENYYLVTYHEKHAKYVNYRVDKMVDVTLTEEHFKEPLEKLDIMKYCTKIFNMFQGADETVILECNHELIGVVIDRFGQDVELKPFTEDKFRITVPIVLSPTFLAWIFQFQDKMKLIGSQNALDQYREMLEKTLSAYK
jgi:predicted DNA-binding transcriptional regulator YafY